MKALYIGSFDCFTIGHMDVLEQAFPLFDKIVVAVSCAPGKKRRYTVESCVAFIQRAVEKKGSSWSKKVDVIAAAGLATDIAESFGCEYIVRGVRNTTDYAYEENLAGAYHQLSPNLKMVYFGTRYSYVSSTFVEELYKNGKNLNDYLPQITGDAQSILEREPSLSTKF